MKIRKHLKTLWDDETRVITNEDEFWEYDREIHERSKSFTHESTTISFNEWDGIPYDWEKEYLKIVKRNNHETIYRIKYEI